MNDVLMMQAFFSNQVEQLYEELKRELFATSPACEKRLVVVPSPAMRSWLLFRMADDPELQVAFGIEVGLLDQTIQKLVSYLDPQLNWSPKPGIELALALEIEIRKIITQKEDQLHSVWVPLFDYLGIDHSHHSLSSKTEKRLTALCDMLGSLFSKYGVYGRDLIKEWEVASSPDWQQELWRRLFKNKGNYPYRLIDSLIAKSEKNVHFPKVQLHLFALSYLPKLYHTFLSNISAQLPVAYYMLSPCQAFWSDLKSDREIIRFKSFYQKSTSSESQYLSMEELLKDRNPLLANLGKLGREMAKQLEESDLLSEENYVLPESIQHHSNYADLIFPSVTFQETNAPLSLLHAIQADLTLLRNPENSEKIQIESDDDSLQVHIVPTQMREVEVLYHTLMGVMHRSATSDSPIAPNDILVMAPEIGAYLPYIKAVFNRTDSCLTAEISDVQTVTQNVVISGFRTLLKLSEARWEVTAILQLLDNAAFQHRFEFDSEQVETIKGWMKTADVRWGYNAEHRDQILTRELCQNGMLDSTETGTWENGLDRILAGLVYAEDPKTGEASPLGIAEHTQMELLGLWIGILRSLKEDLKVLEESHRMTLSEWSCYLQCLLESYFDLSNSHEVEPLLSQIERLNESGKIIEEHLLPFSTIFFHLEKQWLKVNENNRELKLNGVRFCSLLPMRALPAKVVAILGMEEGAYPRRTAYNSLDQLVCNANKTDYCPTQTEYDRYLFLEALISARQHLLLFYRGYGESEAQEQPPSLVVTELLSYIDSAFQLPDRFCIRRHPFLSFDQSYFNQSNTGRIENYSSFDYRLANAYYGAQKDAAQKTTASLGVQERETTSAVPLLLTMSELISFSRNPIKTYLNNSLGIYLRSSEEALKNEEEFQLSHLQKHLIKKASLRTPLIQLFANASREGRFPTGSFKPVAKAMLTEEIDQLHQVARDLGVSLDEIFDIECSEACREPIKEAKKWIFPPLEIPYKQTVVKLIGTIDEVCLQGLIVQQRDTLEEMTKVWPKFMLFTLLIHQYQLPISPQLLLIKESKGKIKSCFYSDTISFMQQLIECYYRSLEEFIPLIPEWVPALLNDDLCGFKATVEQSLNSRFHASHNEYLHWIAKAGLLSDVDTQFERWKNEAATLYAPLKKAWFTK